MTLSTEHSKMEQLPSTMGGQNMQTRMAVTFYNKLNSILIAKMHNSCYKWLWSSLLFLTVKYLCYFGHEKVSEGIK